MKFILKKFNRSVSDKELIDDVKAVAKRLRKNTVTKYNYLQHGQFGISTLVRRFRSWFTVLQLAGLQPVREYDIDKQPLFKNLEKVWIKLGKQPGVKDMKKPLSLYSVHPYIRRFGSWANALEKFIEYKKRKKPGSAKIASRLKRAQMIGGKKNKRAKEVSREVPSDLRMRVFLRDGFKCVICGQGPLTKKGIELHCDHIRPWSKGGRTIVRNLQTLCEACNLKKGSKMRTA